MCDSSFILSPVSGSVKAFLFSFSRSLKGRPRYSTIIPCSRQPFFLLFLLFPRSARFLHFLTPLPMVSRCFQPLPMLFTRGAPKCCLHDATGTFLARGAPERCLLYTLETSFVLPRSVAGAVPRRRGALRQKKKTQNAAFSLSAKFLLAPRFRRYAIGRKQFVNDGIDLLLIWKIVADVVDHRSLARKNAHVGLIQAELAQLKQ